MSLSLPFHIYNIVSVPETQGMSQKRRQRDNPKEQDICHDIFSSEIEKKNKEENMKFRC